MEKFVNQKAKLILLGLIICIFALTTVFRNEYYRNAFNFWTNAKETSPSNEFSYSNLGSIYFVNGQLDKAKQELNMSVKIKPDEKTVHNFLGLIYLKENDFARAEEEFKKEVELNPSFAGVYYNLGNLYHKQNKEDKAMQNWKKAIDLDPSYREVLKDVYKFETTN